MFKIFARAFAKGKKKAAPTEEKIIVFDEKPKLLEQVMPTVTIVDTTHNSVTISAQGGYGDGSYVYGRLGNTDGNWSLTNISFQESPFFNGLESNKEYVFTAYKKGDGIYEKSRLAPRVAAYPKTNTPVSNQYVKTMV